MLKSNVYQRNNIIQCGGSCHVSGIKKNTKSEFNRQMQLKFNKLKVYNVWDQIYFEK